MATGPTYGRLLGRPEFRAVITAHTLSMTGDYLATAAITLLVFERTGSVALSAVTYSLGFLPFLLASVLVTRVLRRYEPRAVLIAVNLSSATCMALLSWRGIPVPLVLAALLVNGLGGGIFSATRAAAMPQILADPDDLVLGRSLIRQIAQFGVIAGSVSATGLLLVAAPQTLLLANGATFLLSAALYRWRTTRRPRVLAARPADRTGGAGRPALLLADRAARRLVLYCWLLPAIVIAPEALGPLYARNAGSTHAVGLLYAAIPAGLLLGEAVIGRFVGPDGQLRAARRIGWLTVVGLVGVCVLPAGIATAVPLLVVVGVGIAHGPGVDRLLTTELSDELRARAFAFAGVGLMASQGVGIVLWGLLGSVTSVDPVLVVAAALSAGLVLALAPRRVASGTDRRHAAGPARALSVGRGRSASQ